MPPTGGHRPAHGHRACIPPRRNFFPREQFVLINDIKPYERNARDNSKSIPAIAESIERFGFRGQIKLRSHDDPTIVAGHHRVEACKLLGWTEIPEENICWCDDLTDDEVKALRLADNRTGEGGKWNRAMVREEIRSLHDMDMSRFKFDFKSKARPYGAERMRGNNEWHLEMCERKDCTGPYELPPLLPVDVEPPDLVSFNFCKSATDFTPGVHFCIDDYQFERVWRKPDAYLELLRKFDCVACPDFSVYTNMPYPMKLWNIYRSRMLGHYWQQNGLAVVPNVTFSDESSYDYCFSCLPRHSTIFMSTVGVTRDREARELCLKGMDVMMERVEPSRVLLLGSDLGFDFGGADVREYKPKSFGKKG